MKKIETPEQEAKRLAKEAKAREKAAKGETTPRGPSQVIKTLAEGAKVMPSEGSKRTVPFVNKDTVEWDLVAKLGTRFEGQYEFTKADSAKILGAVGDLLQEAAEIAFNSSTGVDLSFWNGKGFKFRYNAESTAPDAVMLQGIKVAKDAAKARGVAEADLDDDAEVAEALAAFRASSAVRVANVTAKYSQTLIEREGQLVKKV